MTNPALTSHLRQRGRTRRRTERPPGHQKPAGSVNPGRDPVGLKPHPQMIIPQKSRRTIGREVLQPKARLGFIPRSPRVLRAQRKFAAGLRTLRKRKRITQQQLARHCRISQGKLIRIESGEVNVSLATMLHLAKALGIKTDRLLKNIA